MRRYYFGHTDLTVRLVLGFTQCLGHGGMYSKSVMLYTYADDIVVMGKLTMGGKLFKQSRNYLRQARQRDYV